MILVQWTDNAVRQLENIAEGLEDEHASQRIVEHILRRVETLKDCPDVGPVVQGKLRQLVADGFSVIYRRNDESCQIIAVLWPGQGRTF